MSADKCIVIPAAGASLRLGRPKQLLKYEGVSLVRRAAVQALAVLPNVIVVTGCDADAVRREVTDLHLVLVDNPEWKQGMGTSISIGVQAARDRFPDLEAVLIYLCDTPLIGTGHLARLNENISKRSIELTYTEYDDTSGTPAMFSRRFFDELCSLDGDHGAKRMIFDCDQRAKYAVEFPGTYMDLDLPGDIGDPLV